MIRKPVCGKPDISPRFLLSAIRSKRKQRLTSAKHRRLSIRRSKRGFQRPVKNWSRKMDSDNRLKGHAGRDNPTSNRCLPSAVNASSERIVPVLSHVRSAWVLIGSETHLFSRNRALAEHYYNAPVGPASAFRRNSGKNGFERHFFVRIYDTA